MAREPFACPNCGATDQWQAHYKVPVAQGVELFVGADGPEVGDYAGDEARFDPDDNEYYQCLDCGRHVDLDGALVGEPEMEPAPRTCPACGAPERETTLGYTNLAPYSGYCVNCINRAADQLDKEEGT